MISGMILLACGLGEKLASARPSWVGHYRIMAEVKIDARGVYQRKLHPQLDVVVEAADDGSRPKVHFTTEGHTCVLMGSVSAAQPAKITFDPGQSCNQQVSAPDFKGSLQTTLDRGNVQFLNGQMTLYTRWIVSGEVTQTANPEVPTIVDQATLISRGTGALVP